MKRWIRRFLLKIYIFKNTHNKAVLKSRYIEREERKANLKSTKNQIFNDLYIGARLGEIDITPGDLKLLLSNPSFNMVLHLSKKYRGFRISDHPSMYRKSISRI